MDTVTTSTPTPTLSLTAKIGIISATFDPDNVTISPTGSYGKLDVSREIWRQIVAASAIYDDILAGRSVARVSYDPDFSEIPPAIGAPFAGGYFAGLDMDDKRYAIVVAPKSEGHFEDVDWKTALERCKSIRAGGFDDWRAPTKDESYVIYRGLGPNVTTSDAFKTGQPEAFDDRWYWTSTEYVSGYAWYQFFVDGNRVYGGKGYQTRVRAVRKVLI